MAQIHKKISPEFFEAILKGEKTCELRLADEDFANVQPGDVLVLEEWSGTNPHRQATGRVLNKSISHIGRFTLEDLSRWWSREEMEEKGFLLLSLKD